MIIRSIIILQSKPFYQIDSSLRTGVGLTPFHVKLRLTSVAWMKHWIFTYILCKSYDGVCFKFTTKKNIIFLFSQTLYSKLTNPHETIINYGKEKIEWFSFLSYICPYLFMVWMRKQINEVYIFSEIVRPIPTGIRTTHYRSAKNQSICTHLSRFRMLPKC